MGLQALARGPYARDAMATLDWYNDRLQILVLDGQCDEVAVFVRLNADGTIAEILIRDDLMSLTKPERADALSAWRKSRDGH